MNLYYIISFVLYFTFFFSISIYFYFKKFSNNSYILGDKQVSYWVTAISAQASDMSDWLFMGYPGLIYGAGLFNAWIAIGLVGFMFLNWQFIAPRLRALTGKYESLTLASFFASHFQDSSGYLKKATVFFTTFFVTFYISAELIGLGRLFESVFGINYNIGIALSIVLVVINILVGGFTALAWADLFRGIFLLLMIIIVPVFALINLNNWVLVQRYLSLEIIFHELIPDYSLYTFENILLLTFGWGLGYFGSPHILLNFMSIKDPEKINKAKYIGLSWQILVLVAATAIGLIGIIFFKDSLQFNELVFIDMVKQLFHPLFAGFILCAILAATMSVMTSQVFATAAMIGQEFKSQIIATKIFIILIPIASYLLSHNNHSSINDLVSYAWSGIGLSFSPLVISSLYGGNYVNKYGALIGIFLGGFLGIIWPYFEFKFMPLMPGFIILLLVIFAFSYLTNKKQLDNRGKIST